LIVFDGARDLSVLAGTYPSEIEDRDGHGSE
jgi:hypothetical protein